MSTVLTVIGLWLSVSVLVALLVGPALRRAGVSADDTALGTAAPIPIPVAAAPAAVPGSGHPALALASTADAV